MSMGRGREPAGATCDGICATAVADRRTKSLVTRLKQGQAAVISHADIDEVSALSLVAAKPRVIINAEPSITGRYRCQGPGILLAHQVPVIDGVGGELLDWCADGDDVEVKDGWVWCKGRRFGPGAWLDERRLNDGFRMADANLSAELEKFVINTLEYALKERYMILGGIEVPDIGVDLAGKQCLIAIRGANYIEDLAAVDSYLREARPVLIGVDGGADALLEAGFTPHIIIGDMDSVSDKALHCGALLVAHAYTDGRSPAAERLSAAGLRHHVVRSPGTSEDVAMLMAYQGGASLIVAVGSHSNMCDFLEKGRPGMGSTFLVRLLVGSILVDARGASQLYRSRISPRLVAAGLAAAALVPLAVLWRFSGPLASMARLLWLRLRLALGLI